MFLNMMHQLGANQVRIKEPNILSNSLGKLTHRSFVVFDSMYPKVLYFGFISIIARKKLSFAIIYKIIAQNIGKKD